MNKEIDKANYIDFKSTNLLKKKDLYKSLNQQNNLIPILLFFLFSCPKEETSNDYSLNIDTSKFPRKFMNNLCKENKIKLIFSQNKAEYQKSAQPIIQKNKILMQGELILTFSKQRKIDVFIRHMRNSIAHGLFYLVNFQSYLFLVFLDKSKDGNNFIAILSIQSLSKIKEELSKKRRKVSSKHKLAKKK